MYIGCTKREIFLVFVAFAFFKTNFIKRQWNKNNIILNYTFKCFTWNIYCIKLIFLKLVSINTGGVLQISNVGSDGTSGLHALSGGSGGTIVQYTQSQDGHQQFFVPGECCFEVIFLFSLKLRIFFGASFILCLTC